MKTVVLSFLFLFVLNSNAQVSKDSPLMKEMKIQSGQLYERAFNQCDMTYLEDIAHKNLQAYYNRGEAQSRAKFFEDVIKFNCVDPTKKVIRKVQPNSLEVFSLEDKGKIYGAVQSGNLEFFSHEQGKPEVLTGTAKFTQVWLLENGKWLLKEIISFDQQVVK